MTILWQGRGIKSRFVMSMSSQTKSAVPKHKLLVMDIWFNTTKSDIRNLSQDYVYGNSRRNRLVKNIKELSSS